MKIKHDIIPREEMTTYTFKCLKCGKDIEKFRFGQENLEKWKKKEIKSN